MGNGNVKKGDEAQSVGGGNKNGEKRYKKGILIFLFSHATLGTSASSLNNIGIILTIKCVNYSETRSTQRTQTSLAQADHYSNISQCNNVEPWW